MLVKIKSIFFSTVCVVDPAVLRGKGSEVKGFSSPSEVLVPFGIPFALLPFHSAFCGLHKTRILIPWILSSFFFPPALGGGDHLQQLTVALHSLNGTSSIHFHQGLLGPGKNPKASCPVPYFGVNLKRVAQCRELGERRYFQGQF